MRYVRFMHEGKAALGVREAESIHIIGYEFLEDLLREGVDLSTHGGRAQRLATVPASSVTCFLPPLARPPKMMCIGMNYLDHAREFSMERPEYPTVFVRFATSLVGHGAPIVRPRVSDSLDYEAELAVVLKGGGRHIAPADAMTHIAGFALFNDATVREYQFKSPQWTMGKNFDATGAFGPELATLDEFPTAGRGLKVETRLNGMLVQSGNTDDLIFDIPALISTLSEAISLEPGDVIVTGTPAGIGWAREPRLLMRGGDVCEVSIEGLGTLSNPIVDEG